MVVPYARAMAASVSPERTVCVVPAAGDGVGTGAGTSEAGGVGVAPGEAVGVSPAGDAVGSGPNALGDAAGVAQAVSAMHRATSGPEPGRRIGQFGW